MSECRFCLSDGDAQDSLISPCLCKGSAKFVHSSCVEKWRGKEIDSEQYIFCPVCKSKYDTRVVISLEVIPDYNNSFIVKLFLHPYIIPITINFLCIYYNILHNTLLCIDNNCEERETIIDYNRLFILLELLCTAAYAGLYLNLFLFVENKQRYLRHSKQYYWIPFSHFIILLLLPYKPAIFALINHLLLPLYISKHVVILDNMNRYF